MTITTTMREGLNDSAVAAYYNLMVESATILGAERQEAESQMLEVLAFETQLANVSCGHTVNTNCQPPSKIDSPLHHENCANQKVNLNFSFRFLLLSKSTRQ